jgi:hypothetical protein
MIVRGRKAGAVAVTIAMIGALLMTNTTAVIASPSLSRNAQAMKLHPRPNDLLANLAGAAIGGALSNTTVIAGAIGGSAAAGAVGAVAGILIAVGCPYAYDAARVGTMLGIDQVACGGPILYEDVPYYYLDY